MELQNRFCKTTDGIRTAYATVGQGSPFVICPGWVSHLHLNWESPKGRALGESIARSHTGIMFDRQGYGLSERKRTDFPLDSEVRTLQAVVDHLKLRRFILFGYSLGGLISVAYAALYPRRLSHLILYGTFARREATVSGECKTGLNLLIKSDWEISSKIMADMFIPDAEPSVRQWFSQNLGEAFDPDLAVPFFEMLFRLDVTDLLPKVHVSTLVMHRREDRVIPFHIGREVAATIPGARFVQLEGNIHLLMLGDVEPMVRGIAEFLGDPIGVTPSKPARKVDAHEREQPMGDDAAQEAHGLIAKMDAAVLSRYRVVGKYTRYDEAFRNTLKDARTRIAAGCLQPSRKRENHLIGAAPGSGKTYFAQQIAASLPSTIRYHELNLLSAYYADSSNYCYHIPLKVYFLKTYFGQE